jgi:hypothetical protein
MSIWVTAILIPLGIAATNLVAQFYFRFVPNIEDQKHHLISAGWWALDILMFAIQGYSLYSITQRKEQVTPDYVLLVASFACAFTFCVVLFAFRRFNHFVHHHYMDFFERHLAIIERHDRVLILLASDPNVSSETVADINALITKRRERNKQ